MNNIRWQALLLEFDWRFTVGRRGLNFSISFFFFTNFFGYFRFTFFTRRDDGAPIFAFDRLRNPKSTIALPLLLEAGSCSCQRGIEHVAREMSNVFDEYCSQHCGETKEQMCGNIVVHTYLFMTYYYLLGYNLAINN